MVFRKKKAAGPADRDLRDTSDRDIRDTSANDLHDTTAESTERDGLPGHDDNDEYNEYDKDAVIWVYRGPGSEPNPDPEDTETGEDAPDQQTDDEEKHPHTSEEPEPEPESEPEPEEDENPEPDHSEEQAPAEEKKPAPPASPAAPATPAAPAAPPAAAAPQQIYVAAGPGAGGMPGGPFMIVPVPPPPPPPPPKPQPGLAGHLFEAFSYIGPLVLLALGALMVTQELLNPRSFWFSDEVRHADVYAAMVRSGDWLSLTLAGLPYPDKPPLYFWFLAMLDRIPGVDQSLAFFLGVAVSFLHFLLATWIMARATGHDRRESLAAGLITLSTLFVAGLAHYPRMDMLFAGFIVLALTCMYRGWIKESAPFWLLCGFFLTGVATLVKGPFALAFVLLPSIIFAFWRGTPGRLNRRDGLPGFALMLIMILGWLGALYLKGESAYIQALLGTNVLGRMVDAWHHAGPWWYYLAALPLICLPWTFFALVAPWDKLPKTFAPAWKDRKTKGGRAWLVICLMCGLGVASAVSGKIAIYLLPLLPCLAALAARPLLTLNPARSRALFIMIALLFGLAGLALCMVSAYPMARPWLPAQITAVLPQVVDMYAESLTGLQFMGAVLLALAFVLTLATRINYPAGALLVVAMGMVCLMQVYGRFTAPSLDTMLSTRAPALALGQYAGKGYEAFAYKVYPGVFPYYAQARVTDIAERPELDSALKDKAKAVIIMPGRHWNQGKGRDNQPFTGLRQVGEFWIVDAPFAVVVKE